MSNDREPVERVHGRTHAYDVVRNRPGFFHDTSFDIERDDGKHITGGIGDLGRAVEKAEEAARKGK